MSRASILVVEDDQPIAFFLQSTLRAAGYIATHCESIACAQASLQASRPDLLLLDLGLPDGNGIDVITSIRQYSDVPILVLSARSNEADIVACLDLGADDYLVKPVGAAELLARVRVALRHAAIMAQRDQLVTVGELSIDLHHSKVRFGDDDIHLTPKEYALLAILAQARGRVITHRKLLAAVWGSEFIDHAHYLRIYMSNLRSKIEHNPADPRYILTEAGVGYRLAEG
jgi:two-component system KDP operon response regulator KdpE